MNWTWVDGIGGIMQPMKVSRVTCAVAALAAVGAAWAGILILHEATSEPRSQVIGVSVSPAGWKTVAYKGTQVAIPSAWQRVDMSGCEFKFVRWAHPNSPPCEFQGGVEFYGSATFDPFNGPGVRRNPENDDKRWGGYVRAGRFAIYAYGDNHDLVQKVLGSVRATEE